MEQTSPVGEHRNGRAASSSEKTNQMVVVVVVVVVPFIFEIGKKLKSSNFLRIFFTKFHFHRESCRLWEVLRLFLWKGIVCGHLNRS